MDKTESILLFCMGIGAMIHLLTSMRKTRGFVQKSSIIRFHVNWKKPLMLFIALMSVYMIYETAVNFYNAGKYRQEIHRAEQYGISEQIGQLDKPEDTSVDMEELTEVYLTRLDLKAQRSVNSGLGYLGMLLVDVMIIVSGCCGYVTHDGWCSVTGAKFHPIVIREEENRLCFYAGTEQIPFLKLPAIPENYEKYAILMRSDRQ
ncbi:MAG: hypothetical protein II916_03515 [Oscillospiraceae bacterium]|nr:hypothetical protein [Oscillospiraceae bacterium]